MLVLSRKVGEKIHIGQGITLTITQIKGNRVKLGIEAPDDLRIVRGELQSVLNEFKLADAETVVTHRPAAVAEAEITPGMTCNY